MWLKDKTARDRSRLSRSEMQGESSGEIKNHPASPSSLPVAGLKNSQFERQSSTESSRESEPSPRNVRPLLARRPTFVIRKGAPRRPKPESKSGANLLTRMSFQLVHSIALLIRPLLDSFYSTVSKGLRVLCADTDLELRKKMMSGLESRREMNGRARKIENCGGQSCSTQDGGSENAETGQNRRMETRADDQDPWPGPLRSRNFLLRSAQDESSKMSNREIQNNGHAKAAFLGEMNIDQAPSLNPKPMETDIREPLDPISPILNNFQQGPEGTSSTEFEGINTPMSDTGRDTINNDLSFFERVKQMIYHPLGGGSEESRSVARCLQEAENPMPAVRTPSGFLNVDKKEANDGFEVGELKIPIERGAISPNGRGRRAATAKDTNRSAVRKPSESRLDEESTTADKKLEARRSFRKLNSRGKVKNTGVLAGPAESSALQTRSPRGRELHGDRCDGSVEGDAKDVTPTPVKEQSSDDPVKPVGKKASKKLRKNIVTKKFARACKIANAALPTPVLNPIARGRCLSARGKVPAAISSLDWACRSQWEISCKSLRESLARCMKNATMPIKDSNAERGRTDSPSEKLDYEVKTTNGRETIGTSPLKSADELKKTGEFKNKALPNDSPCSQSSSRSQAEMPKHRRRPPAKETPRQRRPPAKEMPSSPEAKRPRDSENGTSSRSATGALSPPPSSGKRIDGGCPDANRSPKKRSAGRGAPPASKTQGSRATKRPHLKDARAVAKSVRDASAAAVKADLLVRNTKRKELREVKNATRSSNRSAAVGTSSKKATSDSKNWSPPLQTNKNESSGNLISFSSDASNFSRERNSDTGLVRTVDDPGKERPNQDRREHSSTLSTTSSFLSGKKPRNVDASKQDSKNLLKSPAGFRNKPSEAGAGSGTRLFYLQGASSGDRYFKVSSFHKSINEKRCANGKGYIAVSLQVARDIALRRGVTDVANISRRRIILENLKSKRMNLESTDKAVEKVFLAKSDEKAASKRAAAQRTVPAQSVKCAAVPGIRTEVEQSLLRLYCMNETTQWRDKAPNLPRFSLKTKKREGRTANGSKTKRTEDSLPFHVEGDGSTLETKVCRTKKIRNNLRTAQKKLFRFHFQKKISR